MIPKRKPGGQPGNKGGSGRPRKLRPCPLCGRLASARALRSPGKCPCPKHEREQS